MCLFGKHSLFWYFVKQWTHCSYNLVFYPLSAKGKCAGRAQMGKSWCWPPVYNLEAGYLTIKHPFSFLCLVLKFWFFLILHDCLISILSGRIQKKTEGLSHHYFLRKIIILPFLGSVRRWCAFLLCRWMSDWCEITWEACSRAGKWKSSVQFQEMWWISCYFQVSLTWHLVKALWHILLWRIIYLGCCVSVACV